MLLIRWQILFHKNLAVGAVPPTEDTISLPKKRRYNLWVGEQIKNLRKKNDKTQVNVSEAMGDPAYQKYLSGYENGVDHMPIPVFFAIIEALDASPLELIPPRLFGEDYDVFTVYKSLNKAHQEAARAFIQKLKEAEGAK